MTGRDRAQGRTVLVTSRSFGGGARDVAAELGAHGLHVVRGPADHDTAALAPLLRDAVAWIAGAGAVGDEHLRLAPGLRIVARYGTGTDAVDLDAARGRGVVVTNTPGANAAAVAEHTIALTLACLRHLPLADRSVRDGDWPTVRGRELGALTVGLVGFGEVGRRVAGLASGFGSTVTVCDPALDVDEVEWRAGLDLPLTLVALDTLLERADVVSLHCPPAPAPLVTADALACMRRDAVLINTARAALVDEDAVASALHDGRLGGFGADVLRAPAGRSGLLTAPRTVFTPHCASHTVHAVDRMGHAAVAEVVRVVVHDGAPRHAVA